MFLSYYKQRIVNHCCYALYVRIFHIVIVVCTCTACSVQAVEQSKGAVLLKGNSFAVYALSRGKGVPEEARKVLFNIRALIDQIRHDGINVVIKETRIGIEGELKLCVRFTDLNMADKVFRKVKSMTSGVDLINLVIESCNEGG